MFKILIFSFLLSLTVLSQDFEEEAVQEVPIGSSGIDLFPEEETATPTESSSEATPQQEQEPTASAATSEPPQEQAPEASPESAPDTAPTETPSAPAQ